MELFGGAATCDIPSDWIDASTLRDVPDNQEVFVDRSGELSVIVEILEYQSGVEDSDSAKFFFTDLADADHAVSTEIDEIGILRHRPFLSDPQGAVVTSIKGKHVKAKSGPDQEPHTVYVNMTLFRAIHVAADILVTTHAPRDISVIHNVIVESLEFSNPELFS